MIIYHLLRIFRTKLLISQSSSLVLPIRIGSGVVFAIRQILAENTSDCVGFSVHGVFGDLPDLPTSTTDSERLGYESSKVKSWETEGVPQCH